MEVIEISRDYHTGEINYADVPSKKSFDKEIAMKFYVGRKRNKGARGPYMWHKNYIKTMFPKINQDSIQ